MWKLYTSDIAEGKEGGGGMSMAIECRCEGFGSAGSGRKVTLSQRDVPWAEGGREGQSLSVTAVRMVRIWRVRQGCRADCDTKANGEVVVFGTNMSGAEGDTPGARMYAACSHAEAVATV